MTHPSDQPIGIPGAQPGSYGQGPSLRKPVFGAPAPPQPGGGEALVLAGWGARWGAVLIDGLLRWILAFVIAVLAFVLFSDDPFSTATYEVDGISNLGGIFVTAFVVYSLLLLVYGASFMAAWNGQTPGKRAVGIRVVTEAGVAPTFGQAMLREAVFKTILIGWIGGTFFLPWLLNFLWPLWDDQSRAGHDFMARTRVVRA